nr:hypothetical protein [Tanacetum cinerariifolium]
MKYYCLESKNASKEITNELKESPDALLVKNRVSDSKDCTVKSHVVVEKKTFVPTIAKIEFVKAKQQEKPVRKPVKPRPVNIVRPRLVNTARPNSVVVNAVRTNKVNVVKASACWVWRPTKPNGASITLKRHNYIDVKTINEDVRLQALIDGNKVIFNEASIRRDLRLDDAECSACLPNAAIFEELARMGVLSLEQIKNNQGFEIEKLKKRVKKLEGMKNKRTHGLNRRIAMIDADEDLSLINETSQDQGRINEEELFRVHDLDGDEVIIDITVGKNLEHDTIVTEKEVSTAADEVVTTADDAEITTAATTQQISKDDVTLAQTLIEIKAAKPRTRGVIIVIDEEIARKFEAQMKAEMEKEESIAREKVKANIVVVEQWDEVQAKIDADMELAQKLQTEEQEKLTDAKQKLNILKKKSFDEIQRLFDLSMKKVNIFVHMNTEIVEERLKKTQVKVTEGSYKRAGDKIEQESAKRQRLKKEDDSAELKRCLEIVSKDDDDVTIKATPLSSKSPTIVYYKIYKEGKKSHFKIIRRMVYYLLVKKMYPFTKNILHQLWNDVRLQVDYEVKMAYDLLRLIRR